MPERGSNLNFAAAARFETRPAGSCERVHSTTAQFAFRYTLWALDQPDPARGFTRRRRNSPFATRLGTRPAGSCERAHSTTAQFAFRYTRLGTRPAGSSERARSTTAQFAFRFTLGHSTSRILREGSLDDGAVRLSLHAWAGSCAGDGEIRFSLHAWALDQPDPARGFTRRRRLSLHAWAL